MTQDKLPDINDFRHRCPLQLRFNDVDVLGHVNNTVYFSFYDTGKAHYFSDVRGEEMNWRKVDTVIANVNCAYISSIVFGEDVEVLTRCTEIGEKSFHLQQMLVRRDNGEVKSICGTVMVSIDPATHRSTPVPEEWKHLFEKYEGRTLTRHHS